MSKIILPEFDICHKFVNDTRRRSINSKYFDFYSLAHYVSDYEFNIFISYNPPLFDIDALVFEICKKAKESDLSTYGWKAHRLLVDRRNNFKFTLDDFEKKVVISFSVA